MGKKRLEEGEFVEFAFLQSFFHFFLTLPRPSEYQPVG